MSSFTTAFFVLFSAACAAAAAGTESAGTEQVLPENYCPQDIKLFKMDGVTTFPEAEDGDPSGAPVTILRQGDSSVTVELRQEWFPTVDSVHYVFQDKFKERCNEERLVEQGDLLDTITIQCDSSNPWGQLSICLSDDVNSQNTNLLEGDDANLPPSCHKVFPGIDNEERNAKTTTDEPTVCYSLQIRCESLCVEEVARNRRLRGGITSN